ncbi:hypothetical protein Ahy_B02g060763 [Arachis hypogaea]|uniref:CCHC-type domain-containing protein n=1 Tax=Arachis hypogaea TaxID=3818 RepID=A0A445AJ97_ARAHY|nr:hypothetical protein Ahy_B02g060763 [Arachis hypogaea]
MTVKKHERATHEVGIMHTKWLGAQFKKKVESNLRIKIKELVAKAQKKWNLTVTKSMAAKTKQEALSQIQGAFREQYKRINDYCAELLRANPGSSVVLKGLLQAFEEVIPGVDNRYCVRHLYNNFRKKFPGLELKNQMWQCAKRWQMSRLPFPHAISCITFKGLDLESYVDDCYKKDAYLRYYQEVIHPLNGLDIWERTQYDDVMPPPYRRPSHRLVKKRKRGPGDEDNRRQTHLSRRGQIQRCCNCGTVGHKKGGCTNPKRRGWKVSRSQPPDQTVQRGILRRISCSQPNPPTSQSKKPATRPKKLATNPNDASTQPKIQPKKSGTAPAQSNPKAPSSQRLAKKRSATAASSTSKKHSHSQPTERKRHFSVIQTGAPHVPLQKLKLMAKLPPSAWENL